MSAVPVVEFRDATVGYDHAVVEHAVLSVAAGEVVGLIGPNGSGKTTLVRSVTGAARVIGGTIAVEGRDITAYRPVELARTVGVLPQTVPATFGFTAREYVEMGRHARLPRFSGLGAADEAAVDAAMDMTDTARLSTTPVDRLSGGDLQRLTLAQALAQEPRLLLLDEPTSHLDLNHRLQVLDLVRRLADGGLAVLAVFHDLDMAARYSDRIAVVHGGVLRPAVPPSEVLTPGMLSKVFDVAAITTTDPVTGSVQVVPVVRSPSSAPSRGVRVMVLSGSGSGAAVMRRLVLEGFTVEAGALPLGDTDQKVASALGVTTRELPPFGDMSAEDEDWVRGRVERADAVVVCAGPVGDANIGNLRAALAAPERTVLVGTLGEQDDFVGGQALSAWHELESAAARAVQDWRDVVACIEEVVGR